MTKQSKEYLQSLSIPELKKWMIDNYHPKKKKKKSKLVSNED